MTVVLVLLFAAVIIGGGILQAIWNKYHPNAISLSDYLTSDDDDSRVEPWNGF